MDRFSQSLIVAVFLGAAALVIAPRAQAAIRYATAAQAYARCASDAANGGFYVGLPAGSPTDCRAGVAPASEGSDAGKNGYALWWCDPRGGHSNCSPNQVKNWYVYTGDPPSNPCAELPSVHIRAPGQIWANYSFPQTTTDPVTGASVVCGMTFHPDGPPTWDPNNKQWYTSGVASPSGNMTAGGGGWADGSGAPVPGVPGPGDPPTPMPEPPRICNGASCYDPGRDQYCAGVEGGGQVCVPGSTGRGGGGCASSGTTTLCAGPGTSAPRPPVASVPDPPSQVTGTGTTTQGGAGPGGGVVIVHTTTYGVPGASANNGSSAGDSTPSGTPGNPAPPSSSGGAGSFDGGGSCETPPVCSGDAVLCGIARTQWATTCQVHKDLAGTGPAPSASAGVDPGSVWREAGASGDGVADDANAGIYDQSGFGGSRVCPFHDVTVEFEGTAIVLPFAEGCDPLGWVGFLVVGFALFEASKITMGAR